MTSLVLEIGGQRLRVACNASRGTRRLTSALGDIIVDKEVDGPLGYVIDAPSGRRRVTRLTDRAGALLCSSFRIKPVLAALGGHLTAFLPLTAGCVRLRAGALIASDHAVLLLAPLPFMPAIDERAVSASPYRLLDRLAIDVDAEGNLQPVTVPWPQLAELGPAAGHATQVDQPLPITKLALVTPPNQPPPGIPTLTVELAGCAIGGTPSDVLDVCLCIATSADAEVVSSATNTAISTVFGRL